MQIIEVTDSLFASFLPKRDENTSKFDYGRATLIGGSFDYGGAPLLSFSSLSALRLGAGFSSLYVPEPLYSIYIGRNPQTIVHPFPSKDGNIVFDETVLSEICAKSNSIAIGMGVTGFRECAKILKYLLQNFNGYLVIDAGGLTALSELDSSLLRNPSCEVILTPHSGEFSRLSGYPRLAIEKDPLGYLNRYLADKRITVLLKGHRTYISNGEETYLSRFGNTGLSKGGSGDLLSGILCGIFAQNIGGSVSKKAAFGAYLLGKSADLLLSKESEYSIIADDIIATLPKAILLCVEK